MTRTSIDISVVLVYLITITVVGIWVGRKHAGTSEGYFLGERKFNWVMIGLSVYATNISITFFTAWTGLAMTAGIAAFNPELLGGIMLAISAIIFIPIYVRTRIFTIPQFLEMRFNKSAKLFYGILEVLQKFLVQPIGSLAASMAILAMFEFEITPTNVFFCALSVMCTVGLYAIIGGITSVVITDMIQVVIMFVAAIAISVIGIIKVGGLSEIHAALGTTHFELLRPADDQAFPWIALPGQGLHSAFFAFCSIAVLQRALAAKSVEDAQKGLLLASYLKLGNIFVFVIPGMVAVMLFAEVNPDIAYVTMVRQFLVPGFSGLVLAAMIAALMSSQDSNVNSTASLVAMDIYPAIVKNPNPKTALRIGKITAVVLMANGVIQAPMLLGANQSLFNLLMRVFSFMILPTGICYLFGRFNKRINSHGALTCIIVGAVLAIYYIACNNYAPNLLPPFMRDENTHFYVVFFWMALFLSVLIHVVSYLTPKPEPEKFEFMQATRQEAAPAAVAQPWYRRFKTWFIGYIVIFAAFYLIF